jgi:hypothetical protein
MASSRDIVCRNFKKREKLFLNYESQCQVELGDIATWHGRKASFNTINRLSVLGIHYHVETSTVRSTKLYNSASGVKMGFSASGRTGNPTMEFKYRGASRYCLQAYDTVVESIDVVDLAEQITNAIVTGTINWDRNWIVVTTLWKAGSYTQLVAGSKDAEADICASPGAVNSAFNIADTSIGVNLGYMSELCSQEVAGTGARPFFIGMKYRQQPGKTPYMTRYGS